MKRTFGGGEMFWRHEERRPRENPEDVAEKGGRLAAAATIVVATATTVVGSAATTVVTAAGNPDDHEQDDPAAAIVTKEIAHCVLPPFKPSLAYYDRAQSWWQMGGEIFKKIRDTALEEIETLYHPIKCKEHPVMRWSSASYREFQNQKHLKIKEKLR